MQDNTLEHIIEWISEKISEITGTDLHAINPDRNILDYGLDSLRSVNLIGQIEMRLGKDIPVTSILDHPTIRRLAEFIHLQTVIA